MDVSNPSWYHFWMTNFRRLMLNLPRIGWSAWQCELLVRDSLRGCSYRRTLLVATATRVALAVAMGPDWLPMGWNQLNSVLLLAQIYWSVVLVMHPCQKKPMKKSFSIRNVVIFATEKMAWELPRSGRSGCYIEITCRVHCACGCGANNWSGWPIHGG